MSLCAILVLLCLAVPGFGKPPAPINVAMDSWNLRNVIRWNRPPGLTHHEHVTYTVEFKHNAPKQNYNMACVTQDLYCDLTLVSHEFSARVRAAVGGSESDWVTIHFNPNEKSSGKPLLPPSSVAVDSVNLRNTLRWSRPPGLTEDDHVVYMVRYKMIYVNSDYENQDFYTNETRELYCDLVYANYRFLAGVRAIVGDQESDWVMVDFDPYEDTVITPPELLVASTLGNLELSFSGPMVANGGSIKDFYGELDYHVVYWKKLDPSKVMKMNTSLSTVVLNNLEKWSTYCVKVQAYIADYGKSGQFSPVICKDTTDDGKTPDWHIALVFLGTVLLVMSVIFGVCFGIYFTYRQYKSFPSYSIPQHLKEYLSAPFYSPPPLQTPPSTECGDCNTTLMLVSVEGEEQERKDAD